MVEFFGDWFNTTALLLGIVTIIVVAMILILHRDSSTHTTHVTEEALAPPVAIANGSIPPQDERRRHVRRKGWPTRVYLRLDDASDDDIRAFIVDRSEGGVRIAVQQRLPSGRSLRVRAEEAPDESPWVPIVVKHGTRVGDYFEVGCQFAEPPSWSVLVLFG